MVKNKILKIKNKLLFGCVIRVNLQTEHFVHFQKSLLAVQKEKQVLCAHNGSFSLLHFDIDTRLPNQ